MAKKKTRASKPAPRAATKRKPAKPARKAAKKTPRRAPQGPTAVKTGRGATPRQIGDAVVAHFNSGGADKALWDKYWHPRAESIEGEGMAMAWRGRKAIEGKSQWWTSAHTVHSASAEGPYVGATGFAVKFRMDTEEKETGKRTQGEEIGVYTVQNGKVVREEFMYGSSRVISEARSAGGAGPAMDEEEAAIPEPAGAGV